MNRIYFVLFFFFVCACNQAKSIDIDSAKSPIGLLMDITLSEAINGRDAGPEYMAAGDNCSLFTSNNGIEWSILQGGSTPFVGCSGGVIYGLAQGNGRWVAVGTLTSTYQTNSNNCGLWSSVDGVEWVRHTCPNPNLSYSNTPLRSVVFGNGTFFASGHKMGTGANEDYYGLISSDGISWSFKKLGPTPVVDGGLNSTCYLSSDSAGLHCLGETGSYASSSAILKYSFASSTWSSDTDQPGYLGYSNMPTSPPNYNPNTFWFSKGPNQSRFSFGEGDGANYVNRKLSGGDWEEVVTNEILGTYDVLLNSMAFKGNMIVALGDNCTWMNSADGGANWTPYDSIGSCTYDNGMPDFLSVAYNSYVKLFIGAGRSGRIVYSETGLEPSSWTIMNTGFSGTINTLISKP